MPEKKSIADFVCLLPGADASKNSSLFTPREIWFRQNNLRENERHDQQL